MIKRKVAIVGTVGVPANYGGFETLVENLLDLLPKLFEVTVFCESRSYPEKLETYKGARLVYLKLRANGIQSIIYDMVSILKSYRTHDHILLLGVSGALILPFIKPFSKAQIVTNIDGLEWKRDKWNWFAKKFLKFSERLAVKFSHEVIADNKHIQKYILEEYKRKSTFIAYGANHVSPVDPDLYLKKFPFLKVPYVFTVCRIEPENNIEMQLQAFVNAEIQYPYVIVGNWNSNDYGMSLYKKYSKIKGLILYNPIYDPEELNVLRSNCFFYLHGHSAGGTNPSLVEAMYLGLPIVAFGVNYNLETTFGKAVYYENNEDLKEVLLNLESLDRNSMRTSMLKLAKKHYSWRGITKKYIRVFEKT
jgi:glycosyltransferase involved in cell wall biosynthesis